MGLKHSFCHTQLLCQVQDRCSDSCFSRGRRGKMSLEAQQLPCYKVEQSRTHRWLQTQPPLAESYYQVQDREGRCGEWL